MARRLISTAEQEASMGKKLAIVISVALLTTSTVVYCLWQWVVVPDISQQFQSYVSQSTNHYGKQVRSYLNELEQTFDEIALTIPAGVFAQDDLSQRWLLDNTEAWKTKLPTVTRFELFSLEEMQAMLLLEPKNTTEQGGDNQAELVANNKPVSFVLIDMINRLQSEQLAYVEVAKAAANAKWELHKLTPIVNQVGDLAGVLYTTLSLQGLAAVFNSEDPSLAQITIEQRIGNGAPLAFYHYGQPSKFYSKKVHTVSSSYWQLVYQPSSVAFDRLNQIPQWLYLLTVGLFIICCLAAYWSLRKPAIPKSSAKKVQDLLSDKLATNHASDNQEQTLTEQQQAEKGSVKAAQDEESTALAADNSDIIIPDTVFRAYDIRGLAHEELSAELFYLIGCAVASEVLEAGDTTMVVAYDARKHSQEFATCMTEGIISTGCHVIAIGLGPTPLMNYTVCEHQQANSGVIITASHNPGVYNGCKIVIQGKTLVDQKIQELKQRIERRDFVSSKDKGTISEEDLSQAYIDRVIADVAVIDGWRVVIDTANAAASELAPRLFKALECDLTPLFCQFDGDFPNHDPDPSVVGNLQVLIDTVKEKQADVGFAFDGDGDRLMVITSSGKILWPDQLMMLFAQDVVAKNPGCDVVFDIKSSSSLHHVITQEGGRPVMWKTGHSHIKAMMEKTHALLGGEFSGHIFFKDRWYGFDDGLYTAARLLEIMTLSGKAVEELIEDFPVLEATPEIKIVVDEGVKFSIIDKLIESADFGEAEFITLDGLRVNFEDGWGLVRASNTMPALTLRFEAATPTRLQEIQQLFKRELQKVDKALAVDF